MATGLSSVVPANAGSHSHCRQLLKEAVTHPTKTTSAAAYGSLRSQGRRDGCRRDTKNMTPRSRGAMRPRFAEIPFPPNGREQGMPGARCTRGLVCKVRKENAHEHTGTVGTLRHSLRNGLTAYAVLSPETNSSCLRRCRLDGSIDPVGSNSPPAAWHQPRVSGPHGFAVRVKRRSFCAMCAAHEV